jgi:hypothetical protein
MLEVCPDNLVSQFPYLAIALDRTRLYDTWHRIAELEKQEDLGKNYEDRPTIDANEVMLVLDYDIDLDHQSLSSHLIIITNSGAVLAIHTNAIREIY